MHVCPAAGISFIFVPISQKSREATISSYTACARDVALNNTDLCVAGTWLTVERLEITSFTANLGQETFTLLGPNSGGDEGFKFDLIGSLKIVRDHPRHSFLMLFLTHLSRTLRRAVPLTLVTLV